MLVIRRNLFLLKYQIAVERFTLNGLRRYGACGNQEERKRARTKVWVHDICVGTKVQVLLGLSEETCSFLVGVCIIVEASIHSTVEKSLRSQESLYGVLF